MNGGIAQLLIRKAYETRGTGIWSGGFPSRIGPRHLVSQPESRGSADFGHAGETGTL